MPLIFVHWWSSDHRCDWFQTPKSPQKAYESRERHARPNFINLLLYSLLLAFIGVGKIRFRTSLTIMSTETPPLFIGRMLALFEPAHIMTWAMSRKYRRRTNTEWLWSQYIALNASGCAFVLLVFAYLPYTVSICLCYINFSYHLLSFEGTLPVFCLVYRCTWYITTHSSYQHQFLIFDL